jgi:hypothetical protein
MLEAGALCKGWQAYSCKVRLSPQTGGLSGWVGSVFQRHSLTVNVFEAGSMVMSWKESLVSSFEENFPFIGESTRNVGRETSPLGPV